MNSLNQAELTERVINSLNQKTPTRLISGFNFRQNYENELLFFFKPECFFSGHHVKIRNILEMVFDKFREYRVNVSGAMLLTGRCMRMLSIMDNHYGFINSLSRKADELVSSHEKEEMMQLLGFDSIDDYEIIGGHQFLDRFPGFNAQSLNQLWNTKKSLKLRSGFYFQAYSVESADSAGVILVNGFHPSQLAHFTETGHKVVVFLLNSDTDWGDLKFQMAGETFPEKADVNSIRGKLYKNPEHFGLKNVSVSYNCVHLSAGPFEALFEIDNFLSNVKDTGYQLNSTNIYRLMTKTGFSSPVVSQILTNPETLVEDEHVDLFSFTENKNSEDAILDFRTLFYTVNENEDSKPVANGDG